MWFQAIPFLLLLSSPIESSLQSQTRKTIPGGLQEIVQLKLRTSSKLRDNLLQLLSRLPTAKSYELQESVKLVVEFLENNAASLLESLALLPSLSQLPLDEQLNGILASMEDHCPRFLLPAISVVRNAIRGSSSSVELFEGIHVEDLPKVGLPTIFPEDVGGGPVEGPWSRFLGEVAFLTSTGVLMRSRSLIGGILANLKVVSGDVEVREASRFLVRVLENDQELLEDFVPVQNPYELVRNAIASLDKDDELTAEAVEVLLPHLKVPGNEDDGVSELEAFFPGKTFNYSLLLQTAINLDEVFETFHPHEYSTRKDLTIAVISFLRRSQTHQPGVSELLESLYGELAQKYNHQRWKVFPRSAAATRAMLHGLKADRRSPRIRRLANDVSAALETGTIPGSWSKAMNHAPQRDCHGPSCLVLGTLEGLREVQGIQDHALESSVLELISILKANASDGCPGNFVDDFDDKRIQEVHVKNIDVEELLQAPASFF